jgi:CheY-like chemotaxis protein
MSVAAPGSWQTAILQTIDELKPSPSTPPDARSWRIYQILRYRYVQQLTQGETAERLHITARHVRREQNEAVGALAQIMWERTGQRRSATVGITEQPATGVDLGADWSAQLRQELTALQRHKPEGMADAGEVLRRVTDLLAPVLQSANIELYLEAPPSGLAIAVHATGLRQILVRSITEWSRHLPAGAIRWEAHREAGNIVIQLCGGRAPLEHLGEDLLLQELLAEYGGALALQHHGQETVLSLALPAAPPVRVLVVDDNEDLLHFYRRYLQDTRYQISALTDGARLFETLERVRPDIIVLDVMLPSTDGWELLSLLRQHPLSHSLPILICSVIQEEELALALGASGYLAKPVRRSALIGALDEAIR